MHRPKLLGISGSLRRDSFNTQILETLKQAIADRVDFDVFRLNEVPLYNQDLDVSPAIPGVAALREAIAEADGVVIATPEFNYGIPGVLKNALDWASRPYGEAALIGKPILTFSSSPAFTGGVRAQAQLNETLLAIGARLIVRPQTVIAEVHNKLHDGRLADTASLDFLIAGVNDLITESAQTARKAA